MIGHFNEPVVHLPTGRRGKVVMHPSGTVGISFTSVQFDDGKIEDVPDSDLAVTDGNGSPKITGIRFASRRTAPIGMTLQVQFNRDTTVTVTGKTAGGHPVTVHNLPIKNGEIVLPDEVFFPVL